MKAIKFTIRGNQLDGTGNPFGYHRTTQGSYWNEGSRKYKAWKDYVQSELSRQCGIESAEGKPIVLEKNQKAYLHTKIVFSNNAHSDPDNVQKGIADALFVNDKNLAGSYDFEVVKGKGRVEVEIIIQ